MVCTRSHHALLKGIKKVFLFFSKLKTEHENKPNRFQVRKNLNSLLFVVHVPTLRSCNHWLTHPIPQSNDYINTINCTSSIIGRAQTKQLCNHFDWFTLFSVVVLRTLIHNIIACGDTPLIKNGFPTQSVIGCTRGPALDLEDACWSCVKFMVWDITSTAQA